MFRLPFLRANFTKRTPKKGSPEYKELQDRLYKRKNKEEITEQVAANLEMRIPKFLRWMIGFSALPGLVGAYGLIVSDYNSKRYTKNLEFTGFWVGICTTFMGAIMSGIEAMQYNTLTYKKFNSFFFVGTFRLLASFSHIPLGLYFIYSIEKENWKGLLGYVAIHTGVNIYQAYAAKLGLMPRWVSNIQWPWALYSGTVALFLIYTLINKENYKERMAIVEELSKHKLSES